MTRILEVTREMLLHAEGGELTMRSVAARAGLHLNNVQYYFKTRYDLVKALIAYIGEHYQQAYDALLARVGTDPAVRFRSIVRFNLEDSFKTETRTLFVHLWALLNELDGRTGELIGELYAINIAQLSGALAAVYPDLSDEEIGRRVTLIAGLTEGLMLVRGSSWPSAPRTLKLLESAFTQAMRIAAGQ